MGWYTNKLKLQFEGFLATPPLWKNTGFGEIPQYFTNEITLSQDLVEDLKVPDNLILGKRAEYFFAFYIKHFSKDKLLAQNVVISRAKRTIGEIDFLLRNKEGELIHVELVFKYYLYDPQLKVELQKWIGPNRKDTLVRKLERLRKHQFPLLFQEECKEILRSLSYPANNLDQKVCFKANLFVPLGMVHNKIPLVNNDCIRGYWIRKEDFKEEYYGNYKFHSPKKQEWTIDPSFCDHWCTFVELEEQLLQLLDKNRSPLVWMKLSETEFHRFFVVWW